MSSPRLQRLGNLRRMAKPPTNLRDAVEKTVEATLGSAERSRSAAQGALDDLVESVEDLRKGAEERISRGRRSVTDVLEGRRPATSDDIKELKAELRRDRSPPRQARGAAAGQARGLQDARAREGAREVASSTRAKSTSKRAKPASKRAKPSSKRAT